MEIFDLMSYFRNESAFYGYIELPKEFRTAFQQFFNFFPEFVARTLGREIKMEVTKTNNGLKFTTFETNNLNINSINTIFKQFMESVNQPTNIESHIVPTTSLGPNLFQMQITNLKEHLKAVRDENKFLRDGNKFLAKTVETLVGTQDFIAKNPPIVNVVPIVSDELLWQLRDQVSGNEIANGLVDEIVNEVDKKDSNIDNVKTLLKKVYKKAPGAAAVLTILSLLGLG